MLQSVRSQAPIVQHKREKKPAFGQCTGLLDLERSQHGHISTEHAKIARLRGVDPVGTPVPPELISHALVDSKSLHMSANANSS
jgi:hypothetical protein